MNLHPPSGGLNLPHLGGPGARGVATIVLSVFTLCGSGVASAQYVMGESYPTSEAYHPSDRQPAANCGRLEARPAGLGPLDYRVSSPYTIAFVEVRHFTRDVELLRRGARSGSVAGDLQYMLGTFPNHPRALRATAEMFRRTKGTIPQYMTMGIECWFDRAIAYRTEDPDVRIIYAEHLLKTGKKKEAGEQALIAETLVKNNARMHYNVGLIFFDLGDFDRAKAHATKASELGFDLPGLSNKLKKAGKWD